MNKNRSILLNNDQPLPKIEIALGTPLIAYTAIAQQQYHGPVAVIIYELEGFLW